MANKFYTQETINRVVDHAITAARASQKGDTSITLGKSEGAQELELRKGGYCARFVRQVFETACGFTPYGWRYGAASALEMTAMLERDGHRIDDGSLLPGDILGVHKNAGEYGHVAIYVGKVYGKEVVAENTSSDGRGSPPRRGTKLTPFEDVRPRVTGVYRLLCGVRPKTWPGFRAFVFTGRKFRELALMPNGDHRMDQGKVYWQFKE